MSRDDLERLIQDHLDGRTTPEETARLRARLEQDPEARERFRRSEVVFEALRSMSLQDPPTDLVAGVRSVASPQTAGRGSSRDRFGSRLGLAVTFAAGVVVGGLGLFAMEKVPFEGSLSDLPLGGTVPTGPGVLGDLDRKRIPLGQGEVWLRSRRVGDRVTIQVETRETAGPQIRLEYDPRSMTLISFQRDQEHATAQDHVTFDRRRLELRAAASGRYTLHFRSVRSPAPLEVTVDDGGAVVRERMVVGPRAGALRGPPSSR